MKRLKMAFFPFTLAPVVGASNLRLSHHGEIRIWL